MPYKNKEQYNAYRREWRKQKKKPLLKLRETIQDLKNIYDRPSLEIPGPQPLSPNVEQIEEWTSDQILAKGFRDLILTTEMHQKIMSFESINFETLAKVYQSFIVDMINILANPDETEKYRLVLTLKKGMEEQILSAIDFREKYQDKEQFKKDREKWEGLREKTSYNIAVYEETLQWLKNRKKKAKRR